MKTLKDIIAPLTRTQQDNARALDEIVRQYGGSFDQVICLGTLVWKFPVGGWVGIDCNGLQPSGWRLLNTDCIFAGYSGMTDWDDPGSSTFGLTLQNMEKAVRFAVGADR